LKAPGWTRRGALVAGAGLVLAVHASHASGRRRIRYVDGLLSTLPATPQEIATSKLDAFLCDVADVEEVKDADGTIRYVRSFEVCDKALDASIAHIEKQLTNAYIATRGSDIGKRAGTGIFLQFQSCEPIGRELARIGYFYAKGLRALQVTHHYDNLFGGGSIELVPTGLTPLGIEGIAEMNRLGVLADISHASEPTSLDVAKHARQPFVLSHGACRAIVNHPRCASDEVIRALADSGGVMGIFMMSFWLTTADVPTVEHYLAQIRHVIKVGGIDAVGVASDFTIAGEPALLALGNNNSEGVKGYYDWWKPLQTRGMPGFEHLPKHVVIPELNNIHRMQLIHASLERDGFTSSQLEKIMGGNWTRVLKGVLG
jgi:membrane dipeptidase